MKKMLGALSAVAFAISASTSFAACDAGERNLRHVFAKTLCNTFGQRSKFHLCQKAEEFIGIGITDF